MNNLLLTIVVLVSLIDSNAFLYQRSSLGTFTFKKPVVERVNRYHIQLHKEAIVTENSLKMALSNTGFLNKV